MVWSEDDRKEDEYGSTSTPSVNQHQLLFAAPVASFPVNSGASFPVNNSGPTRARTADLTVIGRTL